MGLLDFMNDAANAGAFGLLAASGPSRNPVSLGQALGHGYQSAQQAQQAALERQQAEQMNQYRAMQMKQMQGEQAQQEAMRGQLNTFRQSLPAEMQALPDNLLIDVWKQKMQPKKPIALGKTLLDPETYKPIATDETWKGEQEAAREARAEEARIRQQERLDTFKMQDQSRRDIAGMNADLRRDLAGQTAAQSGKPPAGYRFTSGGDLETIPGGPADVKAQALAQRSADGATDVDVALTGLRDAYDRLEKGGGITSTKNDPLSNMAASASSSAVGQGVGKMFGTQNQSARNDIAMGRPALLAALMKATGMSAKQMDSNAELKLWLTTATDPTLDVESNRRALSNIERKYLKKGVDTPAGSAPVKIKNNAEYDSLPSGAEFIDPFGKTRRKP